MADTPRAPRIARIVERQIVDIDAGNERAAYVLRVHMVVPRTAAAQSHVILHVDSGVALLRGVVEADGGAPTAGRAGGREGVDATPVSASLHVDGGAAVLHVPGGAAEDDAECHIDAALYCATDVVSVGAFMYAVRLRVPRSHDNALSCTFHVPHPVAAPLPVVCDPPLLGAAEPRRGDATDRIAGRFPATDVVALQWHNGPVHADNVVRAARVSTTCDADVSLAETCALRGAPASDAARDAWPRTVLLTYAAELVFSRPQASQLARTGVLDVDIDPAGEPWTWDWLEFHGDPAAVSLAPATEQEDSSASTVRETDALAVWDRPRPPASPAGSAHARDSTRAVRPAHVCPQPAQAVSARRLRVLVDTVAVCGAFGAPAADQVAFSVCGRARLTLGCASRPRDTRFCLPIVRTSDAPNTVSLRVRNALPVPVSCAQNNLEVVRPVPRGCAALPVCPDTPCVVDIKVESRAADHGGAQDACVLAIVNGGQGVGGEAEGRDDAAHSGKISPAAITRLFRVLRGTPTRPPARPPDASTPTAPVSPADAPTFTPAPTFAASAVHHEVWPCIDAGADTLRHRIAFRTMQCDETEHPILMLPLTTQPSDVTAYANGTLVPAFVTARRSTVAAVGTPPASPLNAAIHVRIQTHRRPVVQLDIFYATPSRRAALVPFPVVQPGFPTEIPVATMHVHGVDDWSVRLARAPPPGAHVGVQGASVHVTMFHVRAEVPLALWMEMEPRASAGSARAPAPFAPPLYASFSVLLALVSLGIAVAVRLSLFRVLFRIDLLAMALDIDFSDGTWGGQEGGGGDARGAPGAFWTTFRQHLGGE
ncbi:hypothetical protein MSPP1_001403 [Malassezia sp. CBS 17886]|nr:hypothetical protein MSPP1_001403 [Malassezia sp. CBS 17886]